MEKVTTHEKKKNTPRIIEELYVIHGAGCCMFHILGQKNYPYKELLGQFRIWP